MIIREELAADAEAITRVTVLAFETLEVSGHTEQFIVRALREAGALTVSLVAETDDQVVGHVAFSPIAISDGSSGWYGLGPVSVLPAYQRQGIGKSLIATGLSMLKDLGGKGCALVGDPGYYERLGFGHYPRLILDGVPPEVFLAMPFTDAVPRGTVTFHEGFWATH